jgi:hypothetical protein
MIRIAFAKRKKTMVHLFIDRQHKLPGFAVLWSDFPFREHNIDIDSVVFFGEFISLESFERPFAHEHQNHAGAPEAVDE